MQRQATRCPGVVVVEEDEAPASREDAIARLKADASGAEVEAEPTEERS